MYQYKLAEYIEWSYVRTYVFWLPAMNDNWKTRLLLSVVIDHLHKIKKRVRLLWNTCIDQVNSEKWAGKGRERGGKWGGKRGKRRRKKG